MPRNQGTSRKGKPKKNERAAGMGRALQKSQRGTALVKPKNKLGGMSVSGGMAAPSISLLSSPMDHGAEKHVSLLELDHLDDFLVQAEMAGREFESEKAQFVVLDTHGTAYQPGQRRVQWQDEQQPSKTSVQFSFEDLSLPRRPPWNESTTPQELEQLEHDSFLAWRRAIATKEEQLFAASDQQQQQQHAYFSRTVTPYEKNLHVWRQLWRVLERSDCVCQVVDARNVTFYLSEDLRRYAKSLGKPMLLIVNKSDYLSLEQRNLWSKYLTENNWEHCFFSAHIEQAKLDKAAHDQYIEQKEELPLHNNDNGSNPSEDGDDDDDDDEQSHSANENDETPTNDQEDNDQGLKDKTPNEHVDDNDKEEQIQSGDSGNPQDSTPEPQQQHEEEGSRYKLLNREQLTEFMLNFAKKHGCTPSPHVDNRYQFGTVGFPNVGKSSVINVLMGSSKNAHGVARVAVGAQPGKTKHFQTLLLPDRSNMMLCDCPGLVFPSFVSNTADLIAAGVYPISQMRDHWPVIELICQRIPREIINASYGIRLPELSRQEMKERGLDKIPPPTADEFLTTYCIARSMLAASSGVPDYTRASRIVIKDYVTGKLLFCHPPPNVTNVEAFHLETVKTAVSNTEKLRRKLLALQQTQESDYPDHETNDEQLEKDKEAQFDKNILDMLRGDPVSSSPNDSGGAKQKAGTTKKKGGKKGKKVRDDDPYGCHKSPDDVMIGNATPAAGLIVNAGKYSRPGYTRRTHYGGARSALSANANSKVTS